MPMSPAQGVLKVLQAAGLPGAGWMMFVGTWLDTTDKQLVIRNTGGLSGEVGVAIDYPSVQLLCRGAPGQGGYDEAYQKIRAAKDAIVAIPSAPQFPELTSCTPIGEIADLGRDDKDRYMFSMNLRLILSYASSGYREALQP